MEKRPIDKTAEIDVDTDIYAFRDPATVRLR
jgi:hypothetical protein